MMVHEMGDVGELHYDRDGGFLSIRWKKLFQRDGANRKLVEKLLEEVRARGCSKVMIDMTAATGVFPDEFIAWAQGPGMIDSAKAGVKSYVTVQPPSSLAGMSVKRWQDVASQNVNGIEVTTVPTRDLGAAWLASR
jgi:hypothetical protein